MWYEFHIKLVSSYFGIIYALLQLEEKLSARVRDLQGQLRTKQSEAQREQQLLQEDETQV